MTISESEAAITPSGDRATLSVWPQPSDEEAAALVAVLLAATPNPDPARPDRSPSRWAMAGRRAALHRIVGGPAAGWGTVHRRGAW